VRPRQRSQLRRRPYAEGGGGGGPCARTRTCASVTDEQLRARACPPEAALARAGARAPARPGKPVTCEPAGHRRPLSGRASAHVMPPKRATSLLSTASLSAWAKKRRAYGLSRQGGRGDRAHRPSSARQPRDATRKHVNAHVGRPDCLRPRGGEEAVCTQRDLSRLTLGGGCGAVSAAFTDAAPASEVSASAGGLGECHAPHASCDRNVCAPSGVSPLISPPARRARG
jgi:hypothetical protein